jgi:hypothetical protein
MRIWADSQARGEFGSARFDLAAASARVAMA